MLQTHFGKQLSMCVGLLVLTPVTMAGVDGDLTKPPLSDPSLFEVHQCQTFFFLLFQGEYFSGSLFLIVKSHQRCSFALTGGFHWFLAHWVLLAARWVVGEHFLQRPGQRLSSSSDEDSLCHSIHRAPSIHPSLFQVLFPCHSLHLGDPRGQLVVACSLGRPRTDKICSRSYSWRGKPRSSLTVLWHCVLKTLFEKSVTELQDTVSLSQYHLPLTIFPFSSHFPWYLSFWLFTLNQWSTIWVALKSFYLIYLSKNFLLWNISYSSQRD